MIYAICQQKGGTGKSSSAVALAQAAHSIGRKCLIVDLDPQGNASYYAGATPRGATVFEVITGRASAKDAVRPSATGPDVLLSSRDLGTLTTESRSAYRLIDALRPLCRVYDAIWIDTPPTVGELQYNAIVAADAVIIPTTAEIGGLQGILQTADTVKRLRRGAAPPVWVLITRHNARATLTRQIAERIQETAEGQGLRNLGTIREAVAIREAQTLQRSLYTYAPHSNPAADYMAALERLPETDNDSPQKGRNGR